MRISVYAAKQPFHFRGGGSDAMCKLGELLRSR